MKFLDAIEALNNGHAVSRRSKQGVRLEARLSDIVMVPMMPFAPAMPAYFSMDDIKAEDWEVL